MATKLSRNGSVQKALELIEEQYEKQLEASGSELNTHALEQLIQHYDEGQLTVLAELLFTEGEILATSANGERSPKPLLEKALGLYNHLNKVQQVFDFEREERISRIHTYLKR